MKATIALAILLMSCGRYQHGGMTISSAAFANESEIPKKYGCSGESISPPLAITGVPANAKSVDLIVTDPDAPGGVFTHWIVRNIPAAASITIAEGQKPNGTEGKNGYGSLGWGPPCPPSGSHHYAFDAQALDTNGHVVAQARLVGTYRK